MLFCIFFVILLYLFLNGCWLLRKHGLCVCGRTKAPPHKTVFCTHLQRVTKIGHGLCATRSQAKHKLNVVKSTFLFLPRISYEYMNKFLFTFTLFCFIWCSARLSLQQTFCIIHLNANRNKLGTEMSQNIFLNDFYWYCKR